MKNNIVNIGIVGVGKLGTYHIQKLLNKSNCNFIGIHDIDKNKMNNFKEKYNINIFDSLESLIDKSDAIIVSAPTIYHYDLAKKSLLKDCHVFIEKPVADNISDAVNLKKISEEKNKIIQVGHIERFNKAFVESLKYINAPQFIEIHRISPFPNRSTDIPVIMDIMIHDLDILLSLNKNNPINYIDASGVSLVTDFLDLVNVRIKFNDGLVANLTASRISSKQMRKIRIFQTNSYLGVDLLNSVLNICSIDKDKDNLIENKTIDFATNDALDDELSHFIECIVKNRNPIVCIDDGIEALKLAVEIEDLINSKERDRRLPMSCLDL